MTLTREQKADALIHWAKTGELRGCWCRYPREDRNNWNVSVRDLEGLPNPVWDILYCPVCGVKLAD